MSSLLVEIPVMAGSRKGDVLTMPCEPGITFGHLKSFLKNKLGQNRFSIFLQERGVLDLDDTRLFSETLRESLCLTSGVPVFFHEGERFPVYVKSLTGKTITLAVYKSYSVLDLCKSIQNVEGIPQDQQRLIYGGDELIKGRLINEYGISENTVIHLIVRLRGGGGPPQNFSLVDVSNDQARIDYAWSDDAPDWRRVRKGFAIEGICKNIECRAFGKPVICSMDFGCFNMHTIVPKCPMCNSMVYNENLGFNNCFYRIRGVKEGSNTGVSVPWTKVGDCYRTWDESEAGVVEWEYMEIAVRILADAKPVPGPTCREAPVAKTCAICFRQRDDQEDFLMLKCCHSYHSDCWKGWSSVCHSKSCKVTCPLCRVIVELV